MASLTPSSSTAVTLSDLSFSWPDGTRVFDGLSLTIPLGTCSLVGANGAGKSTLLHLIDGDLTPTRGSVTAPGEVALVPQHADGRPSATIADALGITDKRIALSHIENGSTDPADYEVVGDDWDIEERAVAELTSLELVADLDRTIATLSGGEASMLAIASRLLRTPTVLLLDEPTNNLDERSRTKLFDIIDGFSGTVLVVSHDLELLERVSHTVELYRGDLRLFGGPYSTYREAIDAEQQAAATAVANAANDLRRQKRELVDAQVALDRRSRTAAKAEREKRVPKIIAHLLRDAAQVSAGKYRAEHRDNVDAAADRLSSVRDDVRDDRAARISMPTVSMSSHAQVVADDRLRIDGPERVALVGANGAGKTTLITELIDSDHILVPYDVGTATDLLHRPVPHDRRGDGRRASRRRRTTDPRTPGEVPVPWRGR